MKENQEFDSEITQKKEPKQKFVGQLKPHKGHKVFKFNTKTGELVPAKVEKQEGELTNRKKIIVEDECIYVAALNLKNAVKRLAKYHGINLKIK